MRIVKAIFFMFAFAAAAISANAQKDDVTAAGSYRLDIKSVSIFPNPAVEYLHVKFEDPIARKSRLTIHNIIGNILDVESETIDEHEIRLK